MLLAFAPLLSASVLMVSGVPVNVASSSRFGHFYRLSVPAGAAPPKVLERALLTAAAQWTIKDGRRAFVTPSAQLATSSEARLDVARQDIKISPDHRVLTLSVQTVGELGALQLQGIDAHQTLQLLGDS